MATLASAPRPWAWPLIAAGVLLLTGSALGDAAVDVRVLARAGAQSALGLLLIGIGVAARAPSPIRERLWLAPSRPRLRACEATTWVIGLLALSIALDRALDWLDLRAGSRLADLDAVLAGIEPGDVAIGILGIAIAPAIAEEVVFRGLLLGALRQRVPTVAAVVLAALLFGLAHFDPVHGVAAAVLGLYLGAITVAAGSVRPGIVAHAINNAFAVVAPRWLGGAQPDAAATAGVAVVLVVGLLVALATLARRLGARRGGRAEADRAPPP